MKISYNWLKRYVALDLEPEELGQYLTNGGLEVEAIEKYESIEGGLKGVVIGHVVECRPHPNADKLSLTKVDIGNGDPLWIVCGAPNVAKGQKVPVATLGAILHKDGETLEIKPTKIRGEFSEGMICAEDELGLGTSHEGIMVLDPEAVTGSPAADYFGLTEDYIFEIGLTPNRTDATSHMGVARDLIAILNQQGSGKKYQFKIPSVDAFNIDNRDLTIPVQVQDTNACPRYSGVTLKDISVGESPDWLKHLLKAAGIRPINNVVDITNFVLMESGQPLHAFDASAVKGNKIVVRLGKKAEKFVTLDGEKRELTEKDLMICNAEEGMCIAGVFGGEDSGVTMNTKSVFLESAHFNPVYIRKTSRHHNLQTDASFRFERGSDPNITIYALKRAALLIRELAGGTISSEIQDVYPHPVKDHKVNVKFRNIDRLIGKKIETGTIRTILQDLGIKITSSDEEGMELSVPTFKVDVTREVDVIEEILRIYGYDRIGLPDTLHSSLSFMAKPDPESMRDLVSDMLNGRGFSEMMNNSLTKSRYAEENSWLDPDKNVRILNPLSSDLGVLRQSLLFGALEVIAYNQNRKLPDIRAFEFGRIYQYSKQNEISTDTLSAYKEIEMLSLVISGNRETESWRNSSRPVDFFDIKASVDALMQRLGISQNRLDTEAVPAGQFSQGLRYLVKKDVLTEFGIISGKLLKQFDIRQDVFFASVNWDVVMNLLKKNTLHYHEIPKFPEVRRDLALLVDKLVPFEELKKTAFLIEKQLLKEVNLFDVYEGDKIPEGKKSYAISFVLQDPDKTLNDKVIDKTMHKFTRVFEEKYNAVLR